MTKRIGFCLRCGYCCEHSVEPSPHGNIIVPCSHLIFDKEKGIAICLIHDSLDQYCEEHRADHSGCITYPAHKDVDCLHTGRCGFRFVEDD